MTTCSPLYCHDCAELQYSQSLCTRRNCSKLSNSATLICLVFVVGSFLCKKFMIFQSSFCDHKQYGSLKKLHDQQSVAGYHHRYAINIIWNLYFHTVHRDHSVGTRSLLDLLISRKIAPSSLPKQRDNIEITDLRQWCIFGITVPIKVAVFCNMKFMCFTVFTSLPQISNGPRCNRQGRHIYYLWNKQQVNIGRLVKEIVVNRICWVVILASWGKSLLQFSKWWTSIDANATKKKKKVFGWEWDFTQKRESLHWW